MFRFFQQVGSALLDNRATVIAGTIGSAASFGASGALRKVLDIQNEDTVNGSNHVLTPDEKSEVAKEARSRAGLGAAFGATFSLGFLASAAAGHALAGAKGCTVAKAAFAAAGAYAAHKAGSTP